MFTQYSSTAWTRLLETQKTIVPCCVLSSFWGELLSSGLHLKHLLSLNAVSLQTSRPHAFCLAFTPLLNHRFDSVLSDCFPPSSASSQSPADDPRKSCCISALAYVIPTYLYVILCNIFFFIFAAAATLRTISVPVKLYAKMNHTESNSRHD